MLRHRRWKDAALLVVAVVLGWSLESYITRFPQYRQAIYVVEGSILFGGLLTVVIVVNLKRKLARDAKAHMARHDAILEAFRRDPA